MHRRQFLKVASAVAASGSLPSTSLLAETVDSTRSVDRVVVVGAGIIGASIAFHLAQRGCEVVVVEKRGAATQASGNSFAWFNASYVKLPFSYHLLSTYSVQEHTSLAERAGFASRQGGSLEWSNDPEAQIEIGQGVRNIQKFGSPTWFVDASEARRLEQNIEFGGATEFAYCPQDGAIDAHAATLALLDSARKAGAKMMIPAEVTGFEFSDRKVRVITDVVPIEADRVVIAAGVGCTELAELAGLSLQQRSTPGFIVTTAAMPRLVNSVIVAPGVHLHQRDDGRVILGEQGGPPDTDAHRGYLLNRPNGYPSETLASEHAARLLEIAKQFVPALADAVVEKVGIGWRPMPMDGLPVVGRSFDRPEVHFAVMHSGVTLAPIIGRLTATEILDDVRVNLLSDFRLERF